MLRLFIFILFLGLSVGLEAKNYHDIATRTQHYYVKHGTRVQLDVLSEVMNSSKITAKIFYKYPAKNLEDRTNKFFCFPAREVDFKLSHIEYNVPGVYLKRYDKTIQKFSIDIGISGLNQENVEWTEAVASWLQEEPSIDRTAMLVTVLGYYGLNKDMIKEISYVRIPEDIKLKQIDVKTLSADARHRYNALKKNHRLTPLKIRKVLSSKNPGYYENTQDDITSLMIYRILVELERKSFGWSYQTYDKNLYSYLSTTKR